MAKFSKGQKVKRINDSWNGVVAGQTYTIAQDTDDGGVVLLEKPGYSYRNSAFELISEPHYTKINPKVGEKYRVVKEIPAVGFNPGDKIEYKSRTSFVRMADGLSQWVDEKHFTTEYLELITEPETFFEKEYKRQEGVDALRGMYAGQIIRTDLADLGYVTAGTTEPINKPKKLTLMQTLTKELKKLLSPRLQKFYKVEIIDRGLELTSGGRTAYINALFANNGDHEKALVEMEADADERIKAEEKE